MRLLLDSHAFLWAADRPDLLGEAARKAIESRGNLLLVSIVTPVELSIKESLGKLTLPCPFEQIMIDLGAELLPIELPAALALRTLPRHHGDPFDRLLVAQAMVACLTLVSRDRRLAAYPVPIIW